MPQQTPSYIYALSVGPLSPSSQDPALSFIFKYAAKVDSMDLSGPYQNWYSPTCHFYNTDGAMYNGGEAIWSWMRELLGRFEKVEHRQVKTWVLHDVSIATNGSERSRGEGKIGTLVMMDCITTFFVKGKFGSKGIEIPRMLSFVVGEAEDGMGTEGLQILEAKTWWDSSVLTKEIGGRKAEMEMKQ